MSYTGLLNTTAQVLRRSATRDAYGVGIVAEAIVYVALPVRVQALTGEMARVTEGQRLTASHRMFCPLGTELMEGDIIKHNDGYSTRTLRVVFINHNAAGQGHHVEVFLREPEHAAAGGGS